MTGDLVVFGEDWAGPPGATRHIVHRLARCRRVLWVNPPGLRAPTAADRPLRTDGDVQMLWPLGMPRPCHPLARRANRHLFGPQIRDAMVRAGIERPILWASRPGAVDALGRLGERAVVYYCGGDACDRDDVDHARLRAMEDELVERADLVLAASPALAARFPRYKTMLLPHGVDLDLFAKPAPRPVDLPDGPVAGFSGSFTPCIDGDLIAGAAEALPHWTFFLIGPTHGTPAALRDLPNVILAGPRPQEALPGYVQHWTVSMLPFRDTPRARSDSPLCLREFLAAGTPIVATDFPALNGYRDVLAAVSGQDWFVRALMVAAAASPNAERAARQRLSVAGETWDKAARKVADALARL